MGTLRAHVADLSKDTQLRTGSLLQELIIANEKFIMEYKNGAIEIA